MGQFSVLQSLIQTFTQGAVTKCLFLSVGQTSKLTAMTQCSMFCGSYGSTERVPGIAGVGRVENVIRQDFVEFWRMNGHCLGILFPCSQDTYAPGSLPASLVFLLLLCWIFLIFP